MEKNKKNKTKKVRSTLKNINKVVIGCFLVILILNVTMIHQVIFYAGVQPLALEKVVSSTGGQAFELDEVGEISPGKTILGLEVIDSLAYFIEKDRGFAIYDVSDPSNCIELDEYSLPYPHDMSIEGDRAIVMDPQIGVVILNITDSTQINELGIYTNITHATHIHTVGDLVYIGDEPNGLKVISTTDPSNPVLLGGWQDSEGDVGDVYIVEEDYAFVGIHLPRYDAPPLSLGLKVLGISDPGNITLECVVGDGNEYAGIAPSD